MVDKSYRLPPPPGLPKELYKIMIHCWYMYNVVDSKYHLDLELKSLQAAKELVSPNFLPVGGNAL